MGDVDVLKFAGPEALAEAAADDWLDILSAGNPHGSQSFVALSGGRIAATFFSALSRSPKVRRLTDIPVHFFWSDERCVPPGDPQSNFLEARNRLLVPIGVPGERVHRVRGEDPPEEAAAQAEAELRSMAGTQDAGLPVLDFVFLGMGEDGHVASLFPGESEQVRSSRAVFRAVASPKPPPRRITLGYGCIAAARNVWVLASGAGKEPALRKSLAGETSLPLALVLQSRSHTRIFTDII